MRDEYELERRTIGGYNAIVYFDPINHRFTITSNGIGGAIIGEYNLVDAEKKFIEAMDISTEAHKLLNSRQDGR